MHSIYTIRNRGSEYQATLGLLLESFYSGTEFAARDIRFYVDGRFIQHNATQPVWGQLLIGEKIYELERGTTSWALIDVLFPENSTVTIQVQYKGAGPFAYNLSLIAHEHFLTYWRGPTVFSVKIVNDFVQGIHIEHYWISNIFFWHLDNRNENISTRVYLLGLQEPETDMMKIQRPNGNTIKLEFTQEFLNNFARSFQLFTREMDGGIFMPNRVYFGFPYRSDRYGTSRDLYLLFLERSIDYPFLDLYMNIAQRVLAPYELIFLTASQLRIMRNAFFARHGFVFQSEDLRNFFGALANYQPNPNFHEGMLTDIDRANIAIIQRLEALVGD